MTATDPGMASVTIVRAARIDKEMLGASRDRVTLHDFIDGEQRTWIGKVRLKPQTKICAHHHGRHEVAAYVLSGRGLIRWGTKLEFQAEIGAGDFVYFAPYAAHEEFNPDAAECLDFLVIRSDNEPLIEKLEITPAKNPTQVQ